MAAAAAAAGPAAAGGGVGRAGRSGAGEEERVVPRRAPHARRARCRTQGRHEACASGAAGAPPSRTSDTHTARAKPPPPPPPPPAAAEAPLLPVRPEAERDESLPLQPRPAAAGALGGVAPPCASLIAASQARGGAPPSTGRRTSRTLGRALGAARPAKLRQLARGRLLKQQRRSKDEARPELTPTATRTRTGGGPPPGPARWPQQQRVLLALLVLLTGRHVVAGAQPLAAALRRTAEQRLQSASRAVPVGRHASIRALRAASAGEQSLG